LELYRIPQVNVLWIVKKNVWAFLNAIHAHLMKMNYGN
jgi:hypothetical protein